MKIPFTLRLAYHSLRATIRAGLIFVCAWIFLIPANASDREALGVRTSSQYPPGLRMMRTARIVVAVAPPQAYEMIAMGVGRGISPLMVRIAFVQMAAGNVMPPSTRAGSLPTNGSDRDIAGPKFIQVD
jgi:hypothetical protein